MLWNQIIIFIESNTRNNYHTPGDHRWARKDKLHRSFPSPHHPPTSYTAPTNIQTRKKSLVQWLQRVLGELPEYPWTGTSLCQATWLQFELYSTCSVDQRMHSLLGTCRCCKVVTKPTSLGVYHCWSGSRNLDRKDKDKSPQLYCSFYHQWR